MSAHTRSMNPSSLHIIGDQRGNGDSPRGNQGLMTRTFSKLSRIAARLSGVILSLFCLYSLLLVCRHAYVDVRFRTGLAASLENDPGSRLGSYSIEIEKLSQIDPSNGRVRNRYASVLGQMKKYEEALKQHQLAKATHNAQNAEHFIAVMQEKLGSYSDAEATMADCLIINPSNPTFNAYYLWLFQRKILELQKIEKEKNLKKDSAFREEYMNVRQVYGRAVRNWAIRAPNDLNAYRFLGNYYVEPLFPLQAYRNFLIGLASMSSMDLNPDLQIEADEVENTISQIFNGWAKPYKNLP
jgi:tetratricopeptide (TPR) repeat protein